MYVFVPACVQNNVRWQKKILQSACKRFPGSAASELYSIIVFLQKSLDERLCMWSEGWLSPPSFRRGGPFRVRFWEVSIAGIFGSCAKEEWNSTRIDATNVLVKRSIAMFVEFLSLFTRTAVQSPRGPTEKETRETG